MFARTQVGQVGKVRYSGASAFSLEHSIPGQGLPEKVGTAGNFGNSGVCARTEVGQAGKVGYSGASAFSLEHSIPGKGLLGRVFQIN